MSGKGGAGAPEPVASPRFPEPGPGLCPVTSQVSGRWRLSGRQRPPASCQPCPRPAARACLLLCSQSWVIEEEFRSEPLKRPACFPACCAYLPDGAACLVLGPRCWGWGGARSGTRGSYVPPTPSPAGNVSWEVAGMIRRTDVSPQRPAGSPADSEQALPSAAVPVGPARLGPARPRPVAQEARPVLCKELDVFTLRDVRVGP